MPKYKILIEGFVFENEPKAVGDIIELTEEVAADGVADSAIEKVIESTDGQIDLKNDQVV